MTLADNVPDIIESFLLPWRSRHMLFNNLDSSNKETKFNQAELGIRKLAISHNMARINIRVVWLSD